MEFKLTNNIKLLSLPPYAPELNPVDRLWDELREQYFYNLAFYSLDALEDQLEVGLKAMEVDQLTVQAIVRRPWMIEALLI